MQRPLTFRLWNGERMEAVGSITFHTDGSYHVNDEYPVSDQTMQQKFGGDRYFLMQGTGLKDKNGKEIYEGDVARFGDTQTSKDWDERHDSGVGEIQWDEKGHWKVKTPGVYVPLYCVQEVVGNIYENPELLK